jgi:hypothetical protein
MTDRALMMPKHLEAFTTFLVEQGYEVDENPPGDFQVLGVLMPDKSWQYLYNSLKREHLTVTTHLVRLAREFFQLRDGEDDLDILESRAVGQGRFYRPSTPWDEDGDMEMYPRD